MRSEDVSVTRDVPLYTYLSFLCDVALFPDSDISKFSFAVDPSSGI
jgi:hypothetical protein